MSIQSTIDLLKMYNKPAIWGEVSIFEEVEIALQKLESSTTQLTDRERFIVSQLTKGLLDVVESTLSNTTVEAEKDALLKSLAGILQFLQYLDE